MVIQLPTAAASGIRCNSDVRKVDHRNVDNLRLDEKRPLITDGDISNGSGEVVIGDDIKTLCLAIVRRKIEYDEDGTDRVLHLVY